MARWHPRPFVSKAVIVTILLAACTAATPAPSPTVVLGGSCTKQIAAKLVDDFFAAWNARDASRVAGLFSSDLSLHDFVGGRARDLVGREALLRYLPERFALDDRFSDLVKSIPENPSVSSANPTVAFMRTASGTTYRGNAKLVCANNLLIDVVMSAE
jgi:nuclear transport factor 2 (NTF2) superfamily protein